MVAEEGIAYGKEEDSGWRRIGRLARLKFLTMPLMRSDIFNPHEGLQTLKKTCKYTSAIVT